MLRSVKPVSSECLLCALDNLLEFLNTFTHSHKYGGACLHLVNSISLLVNDFGYKVSIIIIC